MVITNTEPFTKKEIDQLKEEFDVYIKCVIDVENKICVAGMGIHADGEKILIESGSKQSNIWGGGIDLETKTIDYNSFINIRPNDNNNSNEIQDKDVRDEYNKLTKYFFEIIWTN